MQHSQGTLKDNPNIGTEWAFDSKSTETKTCLHEKNHEEIIYEATQR